MRDGSDPPRLAEIETGRDAVPEGVEWYPLSVTERADRCKGHNRIGGTGVCRQSDGWIFKYC